MEEVRTNILSRRLAALPQNSAERISVESELANTIQVNPLSNTNKFNLN